MTKSLNIHKSTCLASLTGINYQSLLLADCLCNNKFFSGQQERLHQRQPRFSDCRQPAEVLHRQSGSSPSDGGPLLADDLPVRRSHHRHAHRRRRPGQSLMYCPMAMVMMEMRLARLPLDPAFVGSISTASLCFTYKYQPVSFVWWLGTCRKIILKQPSIGIMEKTNWHRLGLIGR